MTEGFDIPPVDYTVFQIPNPSSDLIKTHRLETYLNVDNTKPRNDNLVTANEANEEQDKYSAQKDNNYAGKVNAEEGFKKALRIKESVISSDAVEIRRLPGNVVIGVWTKVKLEAGQTLGPYIQNGIGPTDTSVSINRASSLSLCLSLSLSLWK